MVAADSSRCSEIGRNVLSQQRGNAVDAAVAVALCQGVVNPVASGLGGGAFIMVRLANGTGLFLDARETAPGAVSADMFAGGHMITGIGCMWIGLTSSSSAGWTRSSIRVGTHADVCVDQYCVQACLARRIHLVTANCSLFKQLLLLLLLLMLLLLLVNRHQTCYCAAYQPLITLWHSMSTAAAAAVYCRQAWRLLCCCVARRAIADTAWAHIVSKCPCVLLPPLPLLL
jgi:hypothetical protein